MTPVEPNPPSSSMRALEIVDLDVGRRLDGNDHELRDAVSPLDRSNTSSEWLMSATFTSPADNRLSMRPRGVDDGHS